MKYLILLLMLPVTCLAQLTVKGKIVDAATGKPVPAASIFLDNTTVGTRANEDGTFALYNAQVGQYDVIVTVVGYQNFRKTVILSGNTTLPDLKITPKINMLKTVQVGSDPKRARKLRLFKEQFLGSYGFARECVLVNPEALFLRFSKKEQVLTGNTEDFLEIENKALGYKLKYLVDNFLLDYDSMNVGYEGSVLFEEMKGSAKDSARWDANRAQIYYGSQKHFMRELLTDQMDRYFMVRSFCIKRIDTIKRLEMPDLISFKYDTLKTTDIIYRTDKPNVFALGYSGPIDIFYYKPGTRRNLAAADLERGNRGQVARITFLDDNLYFDRQGLILNPVGVQLEFAWGRSRVAELLPIDFIPRYRPEDYKIREEFNPEDAPSARSRYTTAPRPIAGRMGH